MRRRDGEWRRGREGVRFGWEWTGECGECRLEVQLVGTSREATAVGREQPAA